MVGSIYTLHEPVKYDTKASISAMNRFCYQIYKSSLDEKLVRAGNRIIVSLSGGIDSMSLACLLMTFGEKIDLTFHWVHFNHGLRTESAGEEQFIREFAQEKNIPVSVVRTDQLSGKKGMQNAARHWRNDNLLRIRQELGFDAIALGHHLDDLMETQIWRMVRGGSLFSFNPMTKHSPPFIRPLLYTPKAELEAYLKSIGQQWCEDQSNAGDDYTRNLIRNRLIPVMQECAGGRLGDKLLSLDSDARHLKEWFNHQVPPEEYEQETLSYGRILQLPTLLACEMIHRYLLHHGQTEINRANIELIYGQVAANIGNWSINLKDGMAVFGRNKSISIRSGF